MSYIDKLVHKLLKNKLTTKEFDNILEQSDTFFDSVMLEKELLLSNGLPLLFEKNFISLKTKNTNIKNQTFCIVDIEASNPDVNKGQMIEIGAIKYKNNQIIERYSSLVNTKDIPKVVQEITGITPAMTFDAPNIQTVLEEFKIFLEDSVFVAHNISFDYKYINASFKKYDLGMLNNRKLCTIELAKRTIEAPRYGLKHLSKQLDINSDNHHRALDDAFMTQKIFKISLSNLPQNVRTTEDLIKFSSSNRI
jgi:DNA polymerase-3 subunit epsilon